MEQILEIINLISTTQFIEKYQFLNENDNRLKPEYREILNEWFLCSELELIASDQSIREKINGNRKLKRIYNKQAFDNSKSKKGSYRFDRYGQLCRLI